MTLTQNIEEAVSALLPDYMGDALVKEADPLLDAFPPGYRDADKVQYDQFEAHFGLTPLRGLDAAPDYVQMPGWRRYTAEPGYFGQVTDLTESEITKAVEPGTLADPVDVGDRLGLFTVNTAGMVMNRWRKTIADFLRTGQVDIQDAAGRRFRYEMDGYANQIKVPGTGWFTSATSATPINDLLGFQNALGLGTDSEFGPDSVLLANSQTINEFFAVAQIVSTYKLDYGASPIGLKRVNELVQGFGLPKIVRYDKGYYPTKADAVNKTNFTRFVPNRSLLWLGTRPSGQQPGQFQLTRHAGLTEYGGAKSYPEVGAPDESAVRGISKGLYVRCHYQNRMPHKYELEAGFNGMPVAFYPSAFAAITYT